MAARIVSIIGSRPEIVQAAPLSLAYSSCVEEILVHTGQHYDPGMSDLQIADLRLPLPEFHLGVGLLPLEKGVEVAEERIARVIETTNPDAVLVRGDTSATIAGARAAVAAGVPLLHVEAGLRSYRQDMPEGHNRIGTDGLSDLLFAPCEHARDTLVEEGVPGTVHVTGDVLADVLLATRSRLPEGGEGGEYVLATAHRNYNTDSPERLGAVLDCLRAAERRVIFPLHPRTRQSIEASSPRLPDNARSRDPLTSTEMLVLERGAVAIATDSGGVQREAYLWGVPCITMREETEWIETVSTGWNTPVGRARGEVRAASPPADAPGAPPRGRVPPPPWRTPGGRTPRRSLATATPPSGLPN